VSCRIFISYRRNDSIATAGHLHDRLVKEFSYNNVFMDVDSIPPGVDFVDHLRKQVSACDVLLAVIGPRWLDTKDTEGKRRIQAQGDFVQIEIASALARGVLVIPVLVDGASMPAADELPDALKSLATRNAIELRNTQFHSDADRLIGKIRETVGAERGSRYRRTRFSLGVLVLLLGLTGAVIFFWPFAAQDDSRVAPGFSPSEFRTVDRNNPPLCDAASARTQPAPLGSSGLANLALLLQARASASSLIPGFPGRHEITFLNDGWYNNCRSWIPAAMPAWVELDLGDVFELHSIKLESEHTPYWNDRAPSEFSVRKDTAGEWRAALYHSPSKGAIHGTTEFTFPAIEARYVHVDFTATEGGDLVRIDELEVYGRRIP
jgi:hypothetical protein